MDQLAAAGRFTTQKALPVAENVLGNIGGGLEMANAAAGSAQGFQNYLITRQLALQDPATRSSLANSPLLAGFFNLPLSTQEGPQPGGGGPGAPRLAAALPPLTAGGRATEALARAEERLVLEQPERVAARKLGLPALGLADVTASIPQLQALEAQYPGTKFSLDPQSGNVRASVGGVPRDEFTAEDVQAIGPNVSGYNWLPTNRGTFVLRRPPTTAQFADPALDPTRAVPATGDVTIPTSQGPLRTPATNAELGATPSGGPQPTTTPPTPTAPTEPFVLPPGFQPFPGARAVVAPPEGTVAYPPGAPVAAPPTPAPRPVLPTLSSQAQPSLMGARPALPPGVRETYKFPGRTVSVAGPPTRKDDFSIIASERVIPLLYRAKQAVQRLREKGVLTDDPTGLVANRLRLEQQARLGTADPNRPGSYTADPDAVFILRNLRSAVPLLARGFGEQRTNFREEQRLNDALSFNFVTSSAAEALIDNYIELFSTGQSNGLPGASLSSVFQDWAQNPARVSHALGAAPPVTTPNQQRWLEGSTPITP